MGLTAAILEKSDAVGSVWRRHYDRLHLHTDRARSGLPGLTMPKAYGRYPSRAQVVEYLEAYAAKFALKPVFNAHGSRDSARRAVLARRGGRELAQRAHRRRRDRLGRLPYSPSWPGMEAFVGPILHSSVYRNPAPFAGKRVLVVGYGNSGAEIALDLSEAGVDVTLSVRSPVNVVPRELFGLPILVWGLTGRLFPSRVADSINAPLLRFAIGSIEKLGLKRSPKGPLQPSRRTGACRSSTSARSTRFATDESSFAAIIASFARESVDFKQSPAERFDAIILATGFRPDLRPLLPDAKGVLSAPARRSSAAAPTAEPGLFFCGAIPSALGQLRQIGIEATRIADAAQSLRAA